MIAKFYTTAFITIAFITTSCHRYYTNTNFNSVTVSHKIVAVLPADVILTGNRPVRLTEEDIARQESAESSGFQQSLYNNILRYANTRKYESDIQLQPVEKTAELLKKNNINFRDITSTSDETLCQLLNVHAVVRLKVQKTKYMSDLASLGIGVLNTILTTPGVRLPGATAPVATLPNKTDDIIASCTIQSNGIVLWNDNYKQQANWQFAANDIVDNITDAFGRHFPYRKKKA